MKLKKTKNYVRIKNKQQSILEIMEMFTEFLS